MTIDELLDNYRAPDISEREKGDKFERLMKNFLLTYPHYLGKIKSVTLWKNFSRERDLGIDLVATTADGEYWAVQCKFYAESATVDKAGVDSFISNSGRTFHGKKFAARIFIATTNNFGPNAEKMFQNQTPPVHKITLETLRSARVNWEKLDAGIIGEAAINKLTPREYQLEAIAAAHEHFQNHSRGQLIMACGTGKTFTALKIAEDLTDQRGTILFLVPSLSLLSQTLDAWTADAQKPLNYICVCSDETVANNLEDVILEVNLPVTVTNDPAEISARVKNFRQQNPDRMTVVFSTYQSLDKIVDAKLEFDLAICDEAHRTAGNNKADSDTRKFSIIHDNEQICAKLRLYMTATPKMFSETNKKIASDKDLTVWSMDDTQIFGEEFYRISFKRAIELECLSDYQLLIFAVSEGEIQQAMRDDIAEKAQAIVDKLNESPTKSRKKIDFSFSVDDMAKLVGCLNALSKRVTADSEYLLEGDLAPMHKAVAFLPKIVNSRVTAKIFDGIEKLYAKYINSEDKDALVQIKAAHVDGSKNAEERKVELDKLRDTPTDGNLCRIITNVRCLSEGVDVPSLDAVIFLSPKKSKVDIVQAVGRALRKFDGKKFGYIIVPIIASAKDNPNTRDYYAANNEKYYTISEVVRGLKAHDETMNADVERLALGAAAKKIKIIRSKEYDRFSAEIPFEIFRTELIAKVVDTSGNKGYWWHWSNKVSVIVSRHVEQIFELIKSGDAKAAFDNFLAELRQNINPTISQQDAIDMLAQHLVSRPVFEALFENYSFADQNPVSKSMSEIISRLDKTGLANDRAALKEFYDTVREQCRDMGDAKNRQKIITSLYDNFFRQALPLTVQQLGIVYTPPEVVDFILHSVSDALTKYFHRSISDRNIHILEPFAGTGTFIARLIHSGLIRTQDLSRKYHEEIHANEIVLLAYYIAAVNIENAFHAASRADYLPFDGICLTDTFQTYENDKRREIYLAGMENPLHENSARIKSQLDAKIEIIIGNPPYSVGQKSANDNAQNVHYPALERRIADTYAAKTAATNKNSLYDNYIKAFRWASDRISAGGIVGFVTNAGWLDGAAMDGLRACFENEFTAIYIFNLRGAIRGKIKDGAKREGQNVFDIMTGVAITILVKVPDSAAPAEIHYVDIGDYLSRDEKLSRIADFHSAFSDIFAANEIVITPNARHDWINQRGDSFDNFIILGDKMSDSIEKTFRDFYTKGINTARDAWCYNFSRANLAENMAATIDFYNDFNIEDNDSTKISWSEGLIANAKRHRKIKFCHDRIIESLHRPFCLKYLYYDKYFNERVYQMPKIFPTGNEENLLICVSGIGSNKDFSVLIVDKIISLDFIEKVQCFPLYWYVINDTPSLFEGDYVRKDCITRWILEQARRAYGESVTKEDIFYYVYGFLHLPAYRQEFAAELKKSLPRIILVERVEDFWALSRAGRDLAEIHLNYETQAPPAGVEVVEPPDNTDLRVTKMKLVRAGETLTLEYNSKIKIVGIPARALEYVVNGRSPLEWLVERYQIKTDKASGIVNDPNLWCAERGDAGYILRLAQSLVTVSLKTLEIVAQLPEIKFE